jgi:hypothetical protein
MASGKRYEKKPRMKKRPVVEPPENVWDRQLQESAQAYAAFVIYRSDRENRSLARVRQKVGKSRGLTERWSKEWDWVARARAFDVFEEKRLREEEHRALADMRRRHIEEALAVQALGGLGLNKLLAKERRNPDEITLTPDQVLKLIEIGTRVERLNRGEPDTVVEQREEKSSDDHRRDLRKLLADPGAAEAIRTLSRKLVGES